MIYIFRLDGWMADCFAVKNKLREKLVYSLSQIKQMFSLSAGEIMW
jgi:hypothetical protein